MIINRANNGTGTVPKKVFYVFLLLSLNFGCKDPNKYECPCGGNGVVAHGTIITIDEKNNGDEKAILDAVEKRLGGECCEIESSSESHQSGPGR